MSEASGHRSSRAAQDEVVVGLHGAINRLTTLHGTLRTWFHYERSQQASGIPTLSEALTCGRLGPRQRALLRPRPHLPPSWANMRR
jgi:hypothetical protein